MESKQTQQERLILKILSISIIVLSVIMIVFSAVTLAGGTMLSSVGLEPIPEAEDDQAAQQMVFGIGAMAILLGVWMLLVGVFDLITGIFGFRGAKGNARSAGRAKVMGIIALVFVTAMNIHIIVSSPTFMTICSSIVSIGIQFSFVQMSYKMQHAGDIQTKA